MSRCRLIYKSTSTAEVVSNKTLRNLEQRASDNNKRKGITGLLVLTGNEFLQVLEGGAADVTHLFGQICSDSRHHGLELITFELEVLPLFNEWGMRLVDLYDLPGDKRALISQKYAGKDGEICVPNDPHLVYAFLLDAKHVCTSTPWRDRDSLSASDAANQNR